MMTTTQKLLLILVKEFSDVHTISSLAKHLCLSRQGVWRIVKQLEKEEIIAIKTTGRGKTNTQIIQLNWHNPLTEKTIVLALAQEASGYKLWDFTFKELEEVVDFLLLYGSILHSPKTAGDVDILSVAPLRNLSKIGKNIFTIQKTQEKKIHAYNFTVKEFTQELQRSNKVFIDALKRGIILFGQEKFVDFIKRINHE